MWLWILFSVGFSDVHEVQCHGRFAQLVPLSLKVGDQVLEFSANLKNADNARGERTRNSKIGNRTVQLKTRYVEYREQAPFKMKFSCDSDSRCKAECDRQDLQFAGPWVTSLYGTEAAKATVKCGAQGSVITSVQKIPEAKRAENVQYFQKQNLQTLISAEISVKREFTLDAQTAGAHNLPLTLPFDEEMIEFKWKCEPSKRSQALEQQQVSLHSQPAGT